jgi:hypothetical protein
VRKYRSGNYTLGWVDADATLILLVSSPSLPTSFSDSDDVRDSVKTIMFNVLNIPDDLKKSFHGGALADKTGNKTLWHGQVNCGMKLDASGHILNEQTWYSNCPFWTDGNTLCIQFLAIDRGTQRWNPGKSRARITELTGQ